MIRAADPDTYTGRGFAQTGFGLGLVFGLAAVSIFLVQGFLRFTDARRFGHQYEKVVQSGTLDDMVWYMQPPVTREKSTPEQVVKEMKAGSNARMFETNTANLKALKHAVNEEQSTVQYDGIEDHGDDGLQIYAVIRYKLDSAKPPHPEDAVRFALASCKAVKTDKGKYEWMVQDVRFPYKVGTYVPPEKPADDGHGHGGGGHSH